MLLFLLGLAAASNLQDELPLLLFTAKSRRMRGNEISRDNLLRGINQLGLHADCENSMKSSFLLKLASVKVLKSLIGLKLALKTFFSKKKLFSQEVRDVKDSTTDFQKAHESAVKLNSNSPEKMKELKKASEAVQVNTDTIFRILRRNPNIQSPSWFKEFIAACDKLVHVFDSINVEYLAMSDARLASSPSAVVATGAEVLANVTAAMRVAKGIMYRLFYHLSAVVDSNIQMHTEVIRPLQNLGRSGVAVDDTEVTLEAQAKVSNIELLLAFRIVNLFMHVVWSRLADIRNNSELSNSGEEVLNMACKVLEGNLSSLKGLIAADKQVAKNIFNRNASTLSQSIDLLRTAKRHVLSDFVSPFLQLEKKLEEIARKL